MIFCQRLCSFLLHNIEKDLRGGSHKYLNIHPNKKSEQKLLDKIKDYLHRHGHFKAGQVANDLNLILQGWLNYYTLPKVSYTKQSHRDLRQYLVTSLYKYYNRKAPTTYTPVWTTRGDLE